MSKIVSQLLTSEMANLIHCIYLKKRRLDRSPLCIEIPINGNENPYAKYHLLYLPSGFCDDNGIPYYECRIACEISTIKTNIGVVFYNSDTQYLFTDPSCIIRRPEEAIAVLGGLFAPIPIPDIILSPTKNNIKIYRIYDTKYEEVYVDRLEHDASGNIMIVLARHADGVRTSFPLLSDKTLFEYCISCPDNKPEENNESEDK